jgi:uncharacterized membrane protein (UPF0127 family)
MKILVFDTLEKAVRGLQFRTSIEPDVLFAFPNVRPGTSFHSMNVPEPFDLAFVASDGTVLSLATLTPPLETAEAPTATARAYEAKAGWLWHWGLVPGRRVNF